MEDTIEFEVEVNKKVDVNIHVVDIIEAINNSKMTTRWSSVASLLNGIEADVSDLTDEQKLVVIKFMKEKLMLFQVSFDSLSNYSDYLSLTLDGMKPEEAARDCGLL